MATSKKHIAVYLDPAVQQALSNFCEQRGLKSKKGVVFSAGVNTALAEFFGISGTEEGNIPNELSNIPNELSNIPNESSNILGNIPSEALAVEAMSGKLELGDSAELPKVDSKVVEQLQNDLCNPLPEPEHIEFLKRLVAKKDPLISSDLWQEIERLKERNRLLLIKSREQRQKLEEKISTLEYRDKSQSRRLGEKQARLDELEVELEQARNDYASLLESSTHVANKLRDETQGLRSQLKQERADREEIEAELADLKQKSATASELPEAADLLNQLKSKRKKSKTDLADLEAILEILES